MKNTMAAVLAAVMLVLMLAGCGQAPAQPKETTDAPVAETTGETMPPIPADGDPRDVTCKGSYTGSVDMEQVVAEAGGGKLTNGQLQAWYWAAVASHRANFPGEGPDFSVPLDRQACDMDAGVNSWQQYFLKQALNNWHVSQALYAKGQAEGLPVEERFAPVPNLRKDHLDGAPAVKYLYRHEKAFRPNTMHQAYLDQIPAMLDGMAQEQGYTDADALAKQAFGTTAENLTDTIALYNQGYFYHTNLSYFLETSSEEVEDWFREREEEYAGQGITRTSGRYVDFRQILLIPESTEEQTVTISEDGIVTCEEALWEACQKRADDLVRKWQKGGRPRSEGTFSDLAAKNSMDSGTAADGGAYRRVEQGQMIEPIDSWCFDEARQEKDVTTVRTEYGIHILYFAGAADIWEVRAEEDLLAEKQKASIRTALENDPMTVRYSAITLAEADGGIPMEALLYEDIAHERFPEVPLYFQQDYPGVMYGAHLLRTNGCGVTSLAMVASYMLDQELTPPQMCARYGMYSKEDGTDVTLFMYEPPAMGFYNRFADSEEDAYQALQEGHIVVSIQKEGYWTSGGHYIVVEKLNEDGSVQVRDSNVLNFGKLEGHKQDKHSWESVTKANKKMWIIDKKLTHIPICSRCGEDRGNFLKSDYLCHKCRPALIRRSTYLCFAG